MNSTHTQIYIYIYIQLSISIYHPEPPLGVCVCVCGDGNAVLFSIILNIFSSVIFSMKEVYVGIISHDIYIYHMI